MKSCALSLIGVARGDAMGGTAFKSYIKKRTSISVGESTTPKIASTVVWQGKIKELTNSAVEYLDKLATAIFRATEPEQWQSVGAPHNRQFLRYNAYQCFFIQKLRHMDSPVLFAQSAQDSPALSPHLAVDSLFSSPREA
jgi:hypothetical protein